MFSVIQAASPIDGLRDGTLQHDIGLRLDNDWTCLNFLVADLFSFGAPCGPRQPSRISLIKMNWFLLSIPLQLKQM